MIFLGIVILGAIFIIYFAWLAWTQPHGAPYVAMEMDVVERALEMAHVSEKDIVYDLGSGDGRIPIMAALKYKASAVGIELDFIRYIYSVLRAKMFFLGGKLKFIHDNIFDVRLSEATVVTMYLLQATNEKMMEKLLKELKPGTRIISGAFTFPNWRPILIDQNHSTPYGPLYLYEIGISNLTTKN